MTRYDTGAAAAAWCAARCPGAVPRLVHRDGLQVLKRWWGRIGKCCVARRGGIRLSGAGGGGGSVDSQVTVAGGRWVPRLRVRRADGEVPLVSFQWAAASDPLDERVAGGWGSGRIRGDWLRGRRAGVVGHRSGAGDDPQGTPRDRAWCTADGPYSGSGRPGIEQEHPGVVTALERLWIR